MDITENAASPASMHDFVPRLCIVCGSEFRHRTNDKVCSEQCRKEKARRHNVAYRARNRVDVTKTCEVCGVVFSTADIRVVRCQKCRRSSGKRLESKEQRALRLQKQRSERESLDDAYIINLLRRQSLPVNAETISFQRVSLQLKRELDKHEEVKPYRYPVLRKTCDVCGTRFEATSRTKLRCSEDCQAEAARRNAKMPPVDRGSFVCKTCGIKIEHPQLGRPKFYCSVVCRNGFRKLKGKTDGK